jgi:hypothetical protein
VEQRYPVGLISNGCQAHSDQPLRLLPGQTPEHLAGLLELLAGVSSFVLLPLDKLLLRESPALPWGATLVVVTAVITDELRATLVRLREAGRRLALVNVGGQPTGELIGVVAYEVPEKRTVSHGL